MSRYKPVGWRYEANRHALAAKGISTSRLRRHSFAFFQQQQPQPQPEKKVDYMEPFRSPEEKSDIGKQMVEEKIRRKIAEVDQYLSSRNVSFDDKKRIMDHYVAPLAEKFKSGAMTEKDFDNAVDDKVRHNADMHTRDFRPFSWADCEKEPEHGAFNFIDKARGSD